MVFQEGALFDSLTVRENVGYRLYEETRLPLDEVDARVEEVLGYVGLEDYVERMPSELSGGQRRRVAIARAMAAKPGTICSTTSRRPGSIRSPRSSIDDEIVKLRDLEHVTSIVVTHQLRDAFYIADARSARRGPARRDRPGVVGRRPRDDVPDAQRRQGRVRRDRLDELRRVGDPYLRVVRR